MLYFQGKAVKFAFKKNTNIIALPLFYSKRLSLLIMPPFFLSKRETIIYNDRGPEIIVCRNKSSSDENWDLKYR